MSLSGARAQDWVHARERGKVATAGFEVHARWSEVHARERSFVTRSLSQGFGFMTRPMLERVVT